MLERPDIQAHRRFSGSALNDRCHHELLRSGETHWHLEGLLESLTRFNSVGVVSQTNSKCGLLKLRVEQCHISALSEDEANTER